MTQTLTTEHADQMKVHITTWEKMKTETTLANTQLVKTNSVAIKNNKILTAELQKSKTTINSQKEIIAIQPSQLLTLQKTIEDIELLMDVLKEELIPEYCEVVHEQCHKYVKQECTKAKDLALNEYNEQIKAYDSSVEALANKLSRLTTQMLTTPLTPTPLQPVNHSMGKYPIDIKGGAHPILTPSQFIYPAQPGQPAQEVESHKFHKAIINVTCSDQIRCLLSIKI